MAKSTRYVVSLPSECGHSYVTGVDENGKPEAFRFDIAKAPVLERSAAIELATKLGDYLCGYSEAAANAARKISIYPRTGGPRIEWWYHPKK
jgi:hypothetical protein